MFSDVPDIDTSTTESRVLDGDGLHAIHTTSSSGGGETATTNTKDEEVAFFGSRSHD